MATIPENKQVLSVYMSRKDAERIRESAEKWEMSVSKFMTISALRMVEILEQTESEDGN